MIALRFKIMGRNIWPSFDHMYYEFNGEGRYPS